MFFLNVVLIVLLIFSLYRSIRLEQRLEKANKNLSQSWNQNRGLRDEIIQVKLRQHEVDEKGSQ